MYKKDKNECAEYIIIILIVIIKRHNDTECAPIWGIILNDTALFVASRI